MRSYPIIRWNWLQNIWSHHPHEHLSEIDADPLPLILQLEPSFQHLRFDLLHMQRPPRDDNGIVADKSLVQITDHFHVPPVQDVVHKDVGHFRSYVLLPPRVKRFETPVSYTHIRS